MLVIPSIDVRGGRVVRLVRGDYSRETVFSDDPVAVVSGFLDAGARRVHVVDLDAARGRVDNASAAGALAAVSALASAGVEVQVGGGVRDRLTARRWFDNGASHVVIGSLAVCDPDRARSLCEVFAGRVLIGLDVAAGEARVQGWTVAGGRAVEHLARWAQWPAAGVVHTVIERDGSGGGPDVAALRDVCERFPGPVFASGGVTTIEDVEACRASGAAGAIVGRALHEGRFDLGAALARFAPGAVA